MLKSATAFDGVPLAYELAGEGAPSLVFVHGWSCNRRFFGPQFEHFASRYSCIAMDLAGHGTSGRGRAEWTIDNYARDVAAVVAAEQCGPTVLIGHSMAGAVVTEAASLIEAPLAGVVLVDTHVFDYGYLAAEEMTDLLASMRADLAAFIQGLVADTLSPNAPPDLAAWILAEMGNSRIETAEPSFASLLAWNALPRFQALDVPILAINGSLVGDTARQRYEASWREYRMPDAGHFLQLEDPAGFNRQLQTALDETCLAPAG